MGVAKRTDRVYASTFLCYALWQRPMPLGSYSRGSVRPVNGGGFWGKEAHGLSYQPGFMGDVSSSFERDCPVGRRGRLCRIRRPHHQRYTPSSVAVHLTLFLLTRQHRGRHRTLGANTRVGTQRGQSSTVFVDNINAIVPLPGLAERKIL